tara:strand:+ start:2373 stop:2771 length:399 start_codon:yes stop_codon:yes gene_type:complete
MIIKSNFRKERQSTLPLINIIFLMLVFFLAFAQLSSKLDPTFQLVTIDNPNLVPPPDSLILRKDGSLSFHGKTLSPEEVLKVIRKKTGNETKLNIRILPDRRSEAHQLIDIVYQLRAAGADTIYLVSEREIK